MSDAAYYNENDPFAAQWLRNLMEAGHVMAGEVDERSIQDVKADDVRGFTRCHFFAGIAGWDYALRLAGWPENRPVWTGSCPCQPFSQAGKRKGTADDRHLWPEFHRLIAECRPATVVGEQVASKDGRAWLAAVRADLEALGYAVGAVDLCAAGAGAPHIRQRLWWVADAERGAAERHRFELAGAARGDQGKEEERQWLRPDSGDGVAIGRMADPSSPRPFPGSQRGIHNGEESARTRHAEFERPSSIGGMADCRGAGLEIKCKQQTRGERQAAERGGATGAWDDVEWLPCLDGKARPTQPGIFPLAHGVPGRVGKLRAYGNAIVPQAAAAFIESVMECAP